MAVIEHCFSMKNSNVIQLGLFSIRDTLPAEPVKKVQRTLLLEEVVNIILNQMLIRFVRFQNQNWMKSF